MGVLIKIILGFEFELGEYGIKNGGWVWLELGFVRFKLDKVRLFVRS